MADPAPIHSVRNTFLAPCALLLWAFLLAPGAAAQTITIPEPCAGRSGDALRDCMRDITPAKQILRIAPIEAPPNPAQMINCLRVYPADREFCVRRNALIIACSDNAKHQNFAQCFTQHIGRAPAAAENCAALGAKAAKSCAQRNELYAGCMSDPLRYFACLGAGPK